MGLQLQKEALRPTPNANLGEIFYHNGLTPPGFCWIDDLGVIRRMGRQFCKLTADGTGVSSNSLVNLAGISFDVKNGGYYHYKFGVNYSVATSVTGTGIRLGLTFGTVTIFSGTVRIPASGGGTGGELQDFLTSSGDSGASVGSEAIDTVYFASLEGTIVPSADGVLQLQYARGGSTANVVTPKVGTFGFLWSY